MASPEKFFCSVAQAEYDGIVALIEQLLLLTPHALRLLKSSINFYKRFTLEVVDKNLQVWEQRFLDWADLSQAGDFDKQREARMQFCRAAYVCTAVREAMFPESGNDPAWVNSIPQAIRDQLRIGSNTSTYEVFERFVCKLSLRSILDNFRRYLVEELEKLLDQWLEQLGINKIDQWIADYMNALGETGILEALARLDSFLQCFFEACDFVQTAANYKDDAAEKIQLEQVGDGWQFKTADWITDVSAQEQNLRTRIRDLKSKLVLFEDDKTTGSGTKPDEVMK